MSGIVLGKKVLRGKGRLLKGQEVIRRYDWDESLGMPPSILGKTVRSLQYLYEYHRSTVKGELGHAVYIRIKKERRRKKTSI